ncbi:elongation of very long chain fatty acids protein 1-like [Cryptotermes secundus]|uniref:elongation of very long chain fatty acids protein 1-like n=1 Tax=Cryptotermes secundus TaxID=105785 RepID=UPI000CD7D8CE|nr:elongation of very long chain fatty acids protein 1-like [Cryptotermes secundus]
MVDTWFLMGSPAPILCIVASYLYFVLKLGPKLMASRKPLNMKPFLLAYNFSIAVLSLYVAVMIAAGGLVSHLIVEGCNPKQRSSEHTYKVHLCSWWYLMSKVVELTDTVVFVLRKKERQVSFLHVYHHASQVLFTWAYLKYLPGEQAILAGFINSAVHVVMYFYYMVAAMGPQYQKYLWWKKYMTWIQLGQFVLILGYLIFTLASDCHLPRQLSILFSINTCILLGLFTNFYLQTYKKRKELD